MTYESAIALIEGRYGEESQLIQTAEECDELAHAALKRYRVLAAQAPSAERKREEHQTMRLLSIL